MYDKVMVAWSLSSQRLIVTDICKYAYLHACPFSENHTGECVVSIVNGIKDKFDVIIQGIIAANLWLGFLLHAYVTHKL
jgi:hypothetical protein